MNRLWKKRLKKAFTDGEYIGAFGILTITFGGALSGILLGIYSPISGAVGLNILGCGFGSTFALLFLITLYEAMYKKNGEYDKEILKEEKEYEEHKIEKEVRIKDQIQLEKTNDMDKLQERIKELSNVNAHCDLINLLQEIVETIHHISKNNSLSNEEHYYLEHTLPNDLQGTVFMFEKLSEGNQSEMKPKIMNIFRRKLDGLQDKFINQFQNQLKSQINQRIQVMETRDF